MGEPDKKIASALDISSETVKEHVAALKRHFGVGSRVELGIIWYISRVAACLDARSAGGHLDLTLEVEIG